jgi:hypothetical protein
MRRIAPLLAAVLVSAAALLGVVSDASGDDGPTHRLEARLEGTQLTLSWSLPTADVYEIRTGFPGWGDWPQSGSFSSVQLDVSGVPDGAYTPTIVALTAGEEVARSSTSIVLGDGSATTTTPTTVAPGGSLRVDVVDTQVTLSWSLPAADYVEIDAGGDATLIDRFEISNQVLPGDARSVEIQSGLSGTTPVLSLRALSAEGVPLSFASVPLVDACIPVLSSPQFWSVSPTSISGSFRSRVPQGDLSAGVVDVLITTSDGTVIERAGVGETSAIRINFEVQDLPANEVVEICWRGRNNAGVTDYRCRDDVDLGRLPRANIETFGNFAGPGDDVEMRFRVFNVDGCASFLTPGAGAGTRYASRSVEFLVDGEPAQGLRADWVSPGPGLTVPFVCEDPFLFLTTTPGPHVLTMRVTGLNGRVEETSLQFVAEPVPPSPAG